MQELFLFSLESNIFYDQQNYMNVVTSSSPFPAEEWQQTRFLEVKWGSCRFYLKK